MLVWIHSLRVKPIQHPSGWWLNQPIWKILVKLDHFPNFRDENQKCLSCHHPAHGVLNQPSSIGKPLVFAPKAPLLPAIHDLRWPYSWSWFSRGDWWLELNSQSQLEEICATKGIWWLGICNNKKQHLVYSQIGSSFSPKFSGVKISQNLWVATT